MLRTRNFSKRFSTNLIISIPLLELKSGAYWIKGENGAGKTTLLKSLAGLIPCDGSIEFEDGISLKQSPVGYRQRVNYGPAEPFYPGFLTSKDLLSFIGDARKSPPSKRRELIQKFGIDEYFEKPCDTYSSGMLKKLSLVIAFLGSPQLVILDGPLITLDEHARKTLVALIDKYLQEHHAIILLSSHQSLENDIIRFNQSFIIGNKTLIPLNPS